MKAYSIIQKTVRLALFKRSSNTFSVFIITQCRTIMSAVKQFGGVEGGKYQSAARYTTLTATDEGFAHRNAERSRLFTLIVPIIGIKVTQRK